MRLTSLLCLALWTSPALAQEAPPAFELISSWILEGFGNLYGGLRAGGAIMGLVDSQLIGRPADGLTLGIQALQPHGHRLTQHEVGDFNTVSNIEAHGTFRLFRAWAQGDLLDERLMIRGGVLAADEAFMVDPAAALFINGLFGPLPTLTGNIPAPQYPLGALGLLVEGRPAEGVTVRGAIYDGDAGSEPDNLFGLDLKISGDQGAACFGEVAFEGPWLHPAHASRLTLGAIAGTGRYGDLRRPRSARGLGMGHVMLGQIFSWGEIFARGGLSPATHLGPVHWHLDGGLKIPAALPGEGDLGLGLAWTRFSEEARDASAVEGIPITDAERVVELTATFPLNDSFTIQPDAQLIVTPQIGRQTAWLAGLRVIAGLPGMTSP